MINLRHVQDCVSIRDPLSQLPVLNYQQLEITDTWISKDGESWKGGPDNSTCNSNGIDTAKVQSRPRSLGTLIILSADLYNVVKSKF